MSQSTTLGWVDEQVRAGIRTLAAQLSVIPWHRGGCPAPAPSVVKRRVLTRWAIPEAGWIETGTYRGDSTAYLARKAHRVVTIEADAALAKRARNRFRFRPGIEVVYGDSQTLVGDVLSNWSGPVNLWLDAHFSGGLTHRGAIETPILSELSSVGAYAAKGNRVAVFVDDARCFGGTPRSIDGYPPLCDIVRWAERFGFSFSIEHDIMIITSQ